MAVKLVVFRLIADDLDAKGGVGKGLQHNADELNDVFGHKGQTKEMLPEEPWHGTESQHTQQGHYLVFLQLNPDYVEIT